jgi:6-phosphofructokinase 1
MEDLTPPAEELAIDCLGRPTRPSPLGLSTVYGDNVANYVEDTETVLYDLDRDRLLARTRAGEPVPAFQKAGPRQTIFFDPAQVRAAVVTCGGLCPGINNVIRALVMELHYRYGVRSIDGVRYGLQGFITEYGHEVLPLTPEGVREIHEKGGSILASSRGPQDERQIVSWLERRGVNLLFTIGGDGTLRASYAIYEQIRRRGLPIAVIGIPKTIDNDIAYVQETFGLETAFAVAADSIRSAHTEATGAPNGVGVVKVMGRLSGFIAANAALALNEVNFVLIPEVPFDLEGPRGLFAALEQRLRRRAHAVLVVAEGAGQRFVQAADGACDESGNPVLGDIGIYLKAGITAYFRQRSLEANVKYIDPSYLVRSVPANAHDSIFCMRLAQDAVHAGMAGKTGMLVGFWNDQITHVPLKLATRRRKCLSPEDTIWLNVLEATGQPFSMLNDQIEGRKK